MARLGRAQPFPPHLGRALPSAAPETITLDKWLGDPARVVRRGVAAALLVAGLVAPVGDGPPIMAVIDVSPAPLRLRRPPVDLSCAPFVPTHSDAEGQAWGWIPQQIVAAGRRGGMIPSGSTPTQT